MQAISKWIEAVDAWLETSDKTKIAFDVFVRLGEERYLDTYQSSLDVALRYAATVAESGKRLATELAQSNHDPAGVLLIANLAEQNANHKPPKMEEASRVLGDWPRIRASLQAVALTSDAIDFRLADALKFLGAKPVLCSLFEKLWQNQNEVVSYDDLQDCWPEPKMESTVKRNLQRLETAVSSYDPTGQQVFLDWSHAGRFAKLKVSEK